MQASLERGGAFVWEEKVGSWYLGGKHVVAEMCVGWGDQEQAGLVGMEGGRRACWRGCIIGCVWEAVGSLQVL